MIVEIVRAAGNHSGINADPISNDQEYFQSADVAEAIKKWVDENGESIIDTCSGPFDPTDQYVTTYRDGKIYIHVLAWDGKNHIILPAITDRVVKNAWILPKTTVYQEYYASEFGSALIVPEPNYFFEHGSASGLQPHGLIFLDDPWQHGYPDTDIAPPLFTTQQLIGYVKACIAQKLVITMNVGITQDGQVSPATLEQMKALRQIIRGE